MYFYSRGLAVLIFFLNYAVDFFFCVGVFRISSSSESLSTAFYFSLVLDMVLSGAAIFILLRVHPFHWHCGTFGLLKTVSFADKSSNNFQYKLYS
jgi:hypothetical protein